MKIYNLLKKSDERALRLVTGVERGRPFSTSREAVRFATDIHPTPGQLFMVSNGGSFAQDRTKAKVFSHACFLAKSEDANVVHQSLVEPHYLNSL